MAKPPRAFMSYSHRDRPFVHKLANDLRVHGLNVWIDDMELRVGDSLIQKIKQAINQADYVVVVISATSIKSDWVRNELEIAMKTNVTGNNIKVLPAIIQKCQLPEFLDGMLCADFRDHYEVGFEQLIRTMVPGEVNLKIDRARFVERPFVVNFISVLRELPAGLFWLSLSGLVSVGLASIGFKVLGASTPSFLVSVSAIPIYCFMQSVWNFAAAIGANSAGDDTAKYYGRLTLNPIRHFELISLIISAVLIASGGVPYGWTKTIPVQPTRFKITVSTNAAFFRISCLPFVPVAAISIICALAARLFWTGTIQVRSYLLAPSDMQPSSLVAFVLLNSALVGVFTCFFNLIPLPPLNGVFLLTLFLGFEHGSSLSERLSHIGPILLLMILIVLLIFKQPLGYFFGSLLGSISGTPVQMLGTP